MVRRVATVLFILMVTLVAIDIGMLFILHKFNLDFLSIDTCLDAGGVWNYDNRTCSVSSGIIIEPIKISR